MTILPSSALSSAGARQRVFKRGRASVEGDYPADDQVPEEPVLLQHGGRNLRRRSPMHRAAGKVHHYSLERLGAIAPVQPWVDVLRELRQVRHIK